MHFDDDPKWATTNRIVGNIICQGLAPDIAKRRLGLGSWRERSGNHFDIISWFPRHDDLDKK